VAAWNLFEKNQNRSSFCIDWPDARKSVGWIEIGGAAPCLFWQQIHSPGHLIDVAWYK